MTPKRQILGHPFYEPERHLPEIHRRFSVQRQVILEGVHKLMPQDVIGLSVNAGKWHHDPFPNGLGKTARAGADGAFRYIRLLKIRIVGIENDRLLFLELVNEDLGMPIIPSLKHPGRILHRSLRFRIVVDLEVFGLQNLKVEIVVLHLISTEVLGVGRHYDQECPDGCRQHP